MKNINRTMILLIVTIAISGIQSTCTQRNIPKNFVYVEGGTFEMGQPDPDIGGMKWSNDEQPPHDVTVSSFYISKYEVTQKEWTQLMGRRHPKYDGKCDDCAMNYVSWDDTQAYINKLNAKTGQKYRLPTEAEWEFAALGGNKSKGYIYSGSNTIDSVGWYHKNSTYYKCHPVGLKLPNELGIYDMSGNVEEWCSDWYSRSYYKNSPKKNPKGLGDEDGINRIFRGGSFRGFDSYCRVKKRSGLNPDKGGFIFTGFRLVLE